MVDIEHHIRGKQRVAVARDASHSAGGTRRRVLWLGNVGRVDDVEAFLSVADDRVAALQRAIANTNLHGTTTEVQQFDAASLIAVDEVIGYQHTHDCSAGPVDGVKQREFDTVAPFRSVDLSRDHVVANAGLHETGQHAEGPESLQINSFTRIRFDLIGTNRNLLVGTAHENARGTVLEYQIPRESNLARGRAHVVTSHAQAVAAVVHQHVAVAVAADRQRCGNTGDLIEQAVPTFDKDAVARVVADHVSQPSSTNLALVRRERDKDVIQIDSVSVIEADLVVGDVRQQPGVCLCDQANAVPRVSEIRRDIDVGAVSSNQVVADVEVQQVETAVLHVQQNAVLSAITDGVARNRHRPILSDFRVDRKQLGLTLAQERDSVLSVVQDRVVLNLQILNHRRFAGRDRDSVPNVSRSDARCRHAQKVVLDERFS